MDQTAEGLDISVDTARAGSLHGTVDLKGPTGEAAIAVDADLLSPTPQTPATHVKTPAQSPDSRVQAQVTSPKLALSSLAADLGHILAGSKSSPLYVTVRNVGDGDLNARVASAPAWIQAQLTGGNLTLRALPRAPGRLTGHVLIDSDGGSATILVTATIDSPSTPLPRGYYQGDKLATWWQRVGAHLVDWLPLIPGIVLWQVGGNKHLSSIVAIGVLVTAVPWIYNRCYQQGRTGQSWGKRAMGLKLIAMSDKKPIGIWMAAIRDIAHVLDILILYLGFLLPILDGRRQTLADKAMRTIVISLET